MRDNYKLSELKKREKKPKVDPEAIKIRVADGLLQSLKEAVAIEQGKIKGRGISRKLPRK